MNKKEAANCDCWDVSRFSVFQLAAKETRNIDSAHVPLTLLSQYMPYQYQAVRAGKLSLTAEALIQDRIGNYIDDYLYAVDPVRS